VVACFLGGVAERGVGAAGLGREGRGLRVLCFVVGLTLLVNFCQLVGFVKLMGLCQLGDLTSFVIDSLFVGT